MANDAFLLRSHNTKLINLIQNITTKYIHVIINNVYCINLNQNKT